MAKTFLAFLRKLIGGSPKVDAEAPLALAEESGWGVTPHASVDENAYGPTAWKSVV